MGVKALLDHFRRVHAKVQLINLSYSCIAIDISTWLHPLLSSSSNCIPEYDKMTISPSLIPLKSRHAYVISGILYRIKILLSAYIIPIIIFDTRSIPNILKDDEINKRSIHLDRLSHLSTINSLSLHDMPRAHKQYDQSLRITTLLISSLYTLLQQHSIPYIFAPMEADTQCNILYKHGVVNSVITIDSDLVLHGVVTLRPLWRSHTGSIEASPIEASSRPPLSSLSSTLSTESSTILPVTTLDVINDAFLSSLEVEAHFGNHIDYIHKDIYSTFDQHSSSSSSSSFSSKRMKGSHDSNSNNNAIASSIPSIIPRLVSPPKVTEHHDADHTHSPILNINMSQYEPNSPQGACIVAYTQACLKHIAASFPQLGPMFIPNPTSTPIQPTKPSKTPSITISTLLSLPSISSPQLFLPPRTLTHRRLSTSLTTHPSIIELQFLATTTGCDYFPGFSSIGLHKAKVLWNAHLADHLSHILLSRTFERWVFDNIASISSFDHFISPYCVQDGSHCPQRQRAVQYFSANIMPPIAHISSFTNQSKQYYPDPMSLSALALAWLRFVENNLKKPTTMLPTSSSSSSSSSAPTQPTVPFFTSRQGLCAGIDSSASTPYKSSIHLSTQLGSLKGGSGGTLPHRIGMIPTQPSMQSPSPSNHFSSQIARTPFTSSMIRNTPMQHQTLSGNPIAPQPSGRAASHRARQAAAASAPPSQPFQPSKRPFIDHPIPHNQVTTHHLSRAPPLNSSSQHSGHIASAIAANATSISAPTPAPASPLIAPRNIVEFLQALMMLNYQLSTYLSQPLIESSSPPCGLVTDRSSHVPVPSLSSSLLPHIPPILSALPSGPFEGSHTSASAALHCAIDTTRRQENKIYSRTQSKSHILSPDTSQPLDTAEHSPTSPLPISPQSSQSSQVHSTLHSQTLSTSSSSSQSGSGPLPSPTRPSIDKFIEQFKDWEVRPSDSPLSPQQQAHMEHLGAMNKLYLDERDSRLYGRHTTPNKPLIVTSTSYITFDQVVLRGGPFYVDVVSSHHAMRPVPYTTPSYYVKLQPCYGNLLLRTNDPHALLMILLARDIISLIAVPAAPTPTSSRLAFPLQFGPYTLHLPAIQTDHPSSSRSKQDQISSQPPTLSSQCISHINPTSSSSSSSSMLPPPPSSLHNFPLSKLSFHPPSWITSFIPNLDINTTSLSFSQSCAVSSSSASSLLHNPSYSSNMPPNIPHGPVIHALSSVLVYSSLVLSPSPSSLSLSSSLLVPSLTPSSSSSSYFPPLFPSDSLCDRQSDTPCLLTTLPQRISYAHQSDWLSSLLVPYLFSSYLTGHTPLSLPLPVQDIYRTVSPESKLSLSLSSTSPCPSAQENYNLHSHHLFTTCPSLYDWSHRRICDSLTLCTLGSAQPLTDSANINTHESLISSLSPAICGWDWGRCSDGYLPHSCVLLHDSVDKQH